MNIRPILSTLLRHKTAATLIVLQVALTCAIVCNALFLIGTRITQINEVSGVAENELVRIQLTGIGEDHNADAQTRSDLAILRSVPGVKNATVVNQVPFVNSSWNSSVMLHKDQKQPTLHATIYMGDAAFIDTFGLRLIAGRDFTPDEFVDYLQASQPGAAGVIPVAIITRGMADQLFPAGDAVGQSFYTWGDDPVRVVGVVDHLVRPGQMGASPAREYSMILPLRPAYSLGGNYVLRTEPDRRDEVLSAAIAALRGNGPERIIFEEHTKTFEALRHEYYQRQRAMVWLLTAVIVALLVVTALGIVGLASFWVQQRTRQIGIRRALGATRGQILRYFQLENFLLASIGIVLGMILAYAINQLLMDKYELARLPLYYLPIGALVLWLLGQIAVLGPARRAASVPPAIATRTA